MLTITEIKANKKTGLRQFEIVDGERTEVINPEKQNKNTAGALVSVSEDGMSCVVQESGYKIGVAEDGSDILKPCIFLPAGNSVNQLGVALSKFDVKTKDLDTKVVELNYRNSVKRSSTSAPSSSKIEKFATPEQKTRLSELEEAVKSRVQTTASEEDIEAYKIQMAEYNLAQAYAKRDGVECTVARPRNPQSSAGSFIDRLTTEEYDEYQAIVTACEEAKKNAPKASRKLSDEEKIARREKAVAEKKAAFLAKYGKEI